MGALIVGSHDGSALEELSARQAREGPCHSQSRPLGLAPPADVHAQSHSHAAVADDYALIPRLVVDHVTQQSVADLSHEQQQRAVELGIAEARTALALATAAATNHLTWLNATSKG